MIFGEKDDEPEREDESSSDEEIELTGEITRDFWLKKDEPEDDDDQQNTKAMRRAARHKEKREREDVDEDVEDRKQKERVAVKDVEYTPEMVMKKLTELMGKFGRRGTDKQSMIEDLTLLTTKAKDGLALLKVRTTLAAALFDVNNMGDYMAVDKWKQCFSVLQDIVMLLKSNFSLRLSEDETVDETVFDEVEDEELKAQLMQQAEEEKAKQADAMASAPISTTVIEGTEKVQYVTGNLYSFVNRLHTEYRKSLQNMDPHAPVRTAVCCLSVSLCLLLCPKSEVCVVCVFGRNILRVFWMNLLWCY